MKKRSFDVWLPFVFSAALSAIVLVTFGATGGSNAWVPAFVCFVPMVFYFSATSHRASRERIEALEAKILKMEETAAGRGS